MRSTRTARWAWVTMLMLGLWAGVGGGFAAEFVDHTGDIQVLTSEGDILGTDNFSATMDLGEPRHAGKPGGHSIWIGYLAPATGVLNLSTEESFIDTVLAIYSLKEDAPGLTFFDRLETISARDDNVSNQWERASIGVVAGHFYVIAIDGYAGARGAIRFRWKLRQADLIPPQFVKLNDLALRLGDPLVLDSQVRTNVGGELQWYFNGVLIPGATNDVLRIEDFQAENVGRYSVGYSLRGQIIVQGDPTEIQVNEEGFVEVLAKDKMMDLADDFQPPKPLPSPGPRSVGLHDGASRGYKGTQIFSTTYGQRDPDEPNHCGIPGGSSYWFAYQPPESGELTVDTIGSDFDTVLAVYGYSPPLTGYGDLRALGCDNDSVPDTKLSRLKLTVEKGRSYLIVIDGVNGANGRAYLNYELSTKVEGPLAIVQQPSPQNVKPGGTLRVSVVAGGVGPFRYQWFRDGAAIIGATNALYVNKIMRPRDAGMYEVEVVGAAGTARSSAALVSLVVPVLISVDPKTGAVRLKAPSKAGMSFSLERSPQLGEGHWQGLTNGVSLGDEIVVDAPVMDRGACFFRFLLW